MRLEFRGNPLLRAPEARFSIRFWLLPVLTVSSSPEISARSMGLLLK
jgi:hypothetical protein